MLLEITMHSYHKWLDKNGRLKLTACIKCTAHIVLICNGYCIRVFQDIVFVVTGYCIYLHCICICLNFIKYLSLLDILFLKCQIIHVGE